MAAAAKSLQSCPTLCNPIDGSPPGSSVPGILQARILEWVAISSSNAWKWKVKVRLLSRVRLFMTPWTSAHPAPPSMGFSRQEYWSGVPLPYLNLVNYQAPNYSITCDSSLFSLASSSIFHWSCLLWTDFWDLQLQAYWEITHREYVAYFTPKPHCVSCWNEIESWKQNPWFKFWLCPLIFVWIY